MPEQERERVSEETRLRMSIAARLAAGMLANPNVYQSPSWRRDVAYQSWEVAGNLMRLASEGGA